MPNLEETAATWTDGALVFVQSTTDDDALVRPAAFVFEAPGGLMWVEPSYADPNGAAGLALHQREGLLTTEGRGFVLQTAAGERITVLPYEADDRDLVGDALEWFGRYVQADGRTWAGERERVRGLVLEDEPPEA
ncbi:MAG: hypothetical protein AB7P94_16765 [Steroidobacteraceae bacterium]